MSYSRSVLVLALVLGLLLTSSASSAGTRDVTIERLVSVGDDIEDFGVVDEILWEAVNNSGEWTVLINRNLGNGGEEDGLLRNGVLFLQERTEIEQPPGAILEGLTAFDMNDTGQLSIHLYLDGTLGEDDNSGIYLDDQLVIQEGAVSTAEGFSPGTVYRGFFTAYALDDGRLVAVGSVDDPAIPSDVDRAVVLLTPGAQGAPAHEEVLVKQSQVLAGQSEELIEIGFEFGSFDVNDTGQIGFVAELDGDQAVNMAIYVDQTIVAQEGAPSPAPGRNWLSFSKPYTSLTESGEVRINNSGSWAADAFLDGDLETDYVIVRDGEIVVQEGDILPGTAPYPVTSFGSRAPIDLDDSGRVLWYGEWEDDQQETQEALFLDREILVQAGVTLVGDETVTSLVGGSDAFAMSDDGSYIVFQAGLSESGSSALSLHFVVP